jgi:single-strand DNA-binding protein
MYSNRVTLTGFLGQDSQVKTTRNQTSFTVFSLATKRSWKDRESGEWASQTCWHRCVAWGKLSEAAALLTKGAHVLIEGEIRQREYASKADNGTGKKSITEIRVISIVKLDRAKKNESQEGAA